MGVEVGGGGGGGGGGIPDTFIMYVHNVQSIVLESGYVKYMY